MDGLRRAEVSRCVSAPQVLWRKAQNLDGSIPFPWPSYWPTLCGFGFEPTKQTGAYWGLAAEVARLPARPARILRTIVRAGHRQTRIEFSVAYGACQEKSHDDETGDHVRPRAYGPSASTATRPLFSPAGELKCRNSSGTTKIVPCSENFG